MSYRAISARQARKGGILGMALLFFVMVTFAGAALLSMSTIQRIKTVRNGIDVRLMIAAEAGIETVRGRFTVIPVVQEDWSWLAADPGWTNVGNLTINGISVTVLAQADGAPDVPVARVRSTAVSGVKTRTVEYRVRVATFSDYAVFNAGGGTNTLGTNYKGVGNMYYGGNLDIPNTGAQIFGRSTIVGSILQGYTGPGNNNPATGQSWGYHFPIEAPAENEPAIPLPTWAAPWDSLEDVAEGMNLKFAENTLAIELRGTEFRRYFVRRTVSTGATPSGTDWLNLNSAVSLTPNQRLISTASSITGNGNYQLAFEDVPIPNNSVIYVSTGSVDSVPDVSVTDSFAGINSWTQSTNWGSNSTGGSISWGVGSDYDIVRNNGMPGDPYAKVLLLWGVLDDRRVSIACDHKVILADTISYQTLLDNPELRNFHGDGATGKESDAALNFTEMLGVMSKQDCSLTPTWWNNLNPAEAADTVAGELVPTPHYPNDSYSIDGVYFSIYDTRPYRFRNNQQGEWWGHGGLIAGGNYAAGMGNHFARRNYDWDFRMRETTPPFFLRAYNASAVFIPGSWRTWSN